VQSATLQKFCKKYEKVLGIFQNTQWLCVEKKFQKNSKNVANGRNRRREQFQKCWSF
jgi:hypothetical protein